MIFEGFGLSTCKRDVGESFRRDFRNKCANSLPGDFNVILLNTLTGFPLKYPQILTTFSKNLLVHPDGQQVAQFPVRSASFCYRRRRKCNLMTRFKRVTKLKREERNMHNGHRKYNEKSATTNVFTFAFHCCATFPPLSNLFLRKNMHKIELVEICLESLSGRASCFSC